MVPAHRLATLLQQAKDHQIYKCLFHLQFSDGPHSLLMDHGCDGSLFPSSTVKILMHKDEVWDIKFSHNGTRLASSSKDSCVIIWDTYVLRPLYTSANDRHGSNCLPSMTTLGELHL
jgi:WD repeat-containing protein 26